MTYVRGGRGGLFVSLFALISLGIAMDPVIQWLTHY